MQGNVIYTITANCQDCYRCIRNCPVAAIRITGGQAIIVQELCVKCGNCVRECPQRAKTIRSDLDKAKALFNGGAKVVASVAPSFPAMYPGPLALKLPTALRILGFSHVTETAEGAKYVTEKSLGEDYNGAVCTACPVVVNYVEKYRPEFIHTLIPVAGPIIAHGRLLKSLFPEAKVIFIGPCAAKKDEIERPENRGAVDAALTFGELSEWLRSQRVDLDECEEGSFDSFFEVGEARLFPIQGGMLKTAGILNDGLEPEVFHLSGASEVMELFSGSSNFMGKRIEPLFCRDGCIAGPSFESGSTIFERRANLINYARLSHEPEELRNREAVDVEHDFLNEKQEAQLYTEEQITRVFERTGKTDPVYQLNCGACGYDSCRENALAVLRGMAEPEMCIPYMRRLAQQRTDRIMETIPNGIVVVDSDLNMVKMNPAFMKMFMCNNGLLGRRVSYLLNAEGFERLQTGDEEQYESIKSKYGIRYHEILYALRDEGQYVGIYSDISKLKYDTNQLDVIQTQTLQHAREFLEHQVTFAQEMAHFLGKSTAKSEEIAKRIISLYSVEEEEKA
ncbi:MAG: 4Fe-4S binding protein [Deltaproteobacteria bacterium]|jgi:iron only hydrogenase large subunit-like protein|nr:4Fe-4S binding protein [Deltaproteobacteria bacterium]